MFDDIKKALAELVEIYKDTEKTDMDKALKISEMNNVVANTEATVNKTIEDLQLKLGGMSTKYQQAIEANSALLAKTPLADPLDMTKEDPEAKKKAEEEALLKAQQAKVDDDISIYGSYAAFLDDNYKDNLKGGE